jgi:predicted RNase H-like nuclease (RuvC/YqgF family)
MAFNPLQFKQKKKRAVDPNAPPRPNLLSQDKKLREQTEAVDRLLGIVERQQDQIENLQIKYTQMQQSVDQMLNYLRKGR